MTMKIDEVYEKETGRSAWIFYAHMTGPTRAFWKWIEDKFNALPSIENERRDCDTCVHDGDCYTVMLKCKGHNPRV
jgi:hypothetical protein